MWLIQDSNWKGRVLWKLSGGLATILQNWISCNEQKMREAHITRRGMNFYLLIFIEKIINRKIEHSLLVIPLGLQGKKHQPFSACRNVFFIPPQRGFLWIFPPPHYRFDSIPRSAGSSPGKTCVDGSMALRDRRVGNHQGKPRADGSMTAFYFSSPISR